MKLKLYTLFILLLCGMATFSQEQAPNWKWAKSSGGNSYDESNSITTDVAGNVYLTGYFGSSTITFGNITLTNVNAGNNDIFIVKYTSNGIVLWAQSIGNSNNEYGTSITTDTLGNVYLAGFFTSPTLTFGNITLNNAGGEDSFIVKYDPNGNVLWAQSAGGSLNDESISIITNETGNVYLTGCFQSYTITFGNYTLPNSGGYDIFLVKYNYDGNVLWAKRAGGSDSDEGNGITTDITGNVYLTGYFYSPTLTFSNTTLTNAGECDVFIAKYDHDGNALWAQSAGGSSYDISRSITTDAAGNAYITGKFLSSIISFGNATLTNAGECNVFIAKYDPNGNALWVKSAGGSEWDEGNSITTDEAGNVYLTGYFGSSSITFGNTTLTNIGGCDIFIIKYASDGNVLWAKSEGGSSADYGISITTDVVDNVYLAGYFYSPTLNIGNITLTNANAGYDDIIIARLNLSTGNNGPVCEGYPLTLTVSANPGATFAWSGPNGFTSSLQNPTVSNSATPAMSGTYYVTVTINGVIGTGLTNVTVKNAPTPSAGNNGPVCSGNTLSLTASTIVGASYHWTGPNGFSSSQQNPVVSYNSTIAMSGTYYVTETNNGCTSPVGSTIVMVNATPATPAAGNNGPVCSGNTLSLTASYIASITYHWTGPNGFTSTEQNPVVSDHAIAAMSGTYHVTTSFNSGCTSPIASTNVSVTSILANPNICLVSVDSDNKKNVVVWDKPVTGAINYFKVYSEGSEANGYNVIGTVPYYSVSIYTDTSSNPSQQAYNYKISAVDTCGNESALSPNHKSLHLALSQGIGSYYILTWSYYEGFSCTTYNIYRGTSPTNLSLLTTVPISPNTYTDLTPPAGYVYYQIEAVNPNPCSPFKQGNYNSARSNIVSNNVNAVPEYPNESEISIYPNPANDKLTITIPTYSAVHHTMLKLFDIYGNLLKSITITDSTTTVDISGYPSGVYVVRFMDEKGIVSKRIIKR